MQTTTLPIQPNGAAPSPQRASSAPNLDAGQFSAALSREIEQRQDPAPPPAPAAPAAQSRPAARTEQQQADAPAQADAKAPARDAAKPDEAKPASKAAKADDTADADPGKDDAAPAGHPDAAHVTDMLALVASLKPLQNAPGARAAGEHGGAAAPAATAKPGAQTAQLAALQAAFKALDKDGAGQAAGKPLAAPGAAADPAAAAGVPGAADALDGAAGAKGAADFRTFQEAAAGQLKAHAEPAPARAAAAELAALKEPAPAPLLAQVQPVTLEMAQAVAGAAGERIAARVGTPAWDNQVGQKIVWMAAGEEHSASLTLNPPDLGPLQVVLSVTNDQASVTFSSNQLEVRQALENALPRLREMMGESGIALGNATVNAGLPDQRQAQDGGQPRGGAGRSGRFDGGGAIAEPAPRPAARTTVVGDRGVDTFA